jgi:hypothetical protein
VTVFSSWRFRDDVFVHHGKLNEGMKRRLQACYSALQHCTTFSRRVVACKWLPSNGVQRFGI